MMDTQDMTENQRSADEVLADAIRVLTEAARLRRPAPGQGDGAGDDQVVKTEPADWAEFVTLAVAGAAANVGGVEKALRGRPGSWEAEKVRSMLLSTLGEEPAELLRHRTEPLSVEIWPEEILSDLDYHTLYHASKELIEQQRRAHQWRYRLTEDKAQGERGTWESLDDEAPPFEEPTGDERGETWDLPHRAGNVLEVPRSSDDEAEIARLDELEAAVEALEFEQDPTTYGEALRATVLAKAAELFPGIDVTVEIRTSLRTNWEHDEFYGPEEQLIEAARMDTPLPWSGIAPKDYPAGSSIADVEVEAGRLPHLRAST